MPLMPPEGVSSDDVSFSSGNAEKVNQGCECDNGASNLERAAGNKANHIG